LAQAGLAREFVSMKSVNPAHTSKTNHGKS
jgi:hypothetical protein